MITATSGRDNDFVKVEIPDQYRKNLVIWMKDDIEARKYRDGLVLIQRYEGVKFSIEYIVGDLESNVSLELDNYNPYIILFYVFRGTGSLYFSGTDEIVWFTKEAFWGCNCSRGDMLVNLGHGKVEFLVFRLQTAYLIPVLEDLEGARRLLLGGTKGDWVSECPMLNMEFSVENIIRKDLFNLKPGGLLNARIRTIVSDLLAQFEVSLSNRGGRLRPSQKFREVIQLIVEELETQPNRNVMTEAYFAKKYSIHEVTLKRHFKSNVGKSFAAFRNDLCMMKAKELLVAGMNVNEVTDTLGYTEAANFSRAFKVYFGYVPSKIRRVP